MKNKKILFSIFKQKSSVHIIRVHSLIRLNHQGAAPAHWFVYIRAGTKGGSVNGFQPGDILSSSGAHLNTDHQGQQETLSWHLPFKLTAQGFKRTASETPSPEETGLRCSNTWSRLKPFSVSQFTTTCCLLLKKTTKLYTNKTKTLINLQNAASAFSYTSQWTQSFRKTRRQRHSGVAQKGDEDKTRNNVWLEDEQCSRQVHEFSVQMTLAHGTSASSVFCWVSQPAANFVALVENKK